MKLENDLRSDPIRPLVLRIAIPSMLAQFVSVLYSVVDRMYIGNIAQVGSLALAGAGVCGPIVTMLGSVAFWVGVGGSPLISIRMGEGRQEEARRVLANCFLLLTCLALALTGLAYATRRPALLLFGASPETLPYAMDYYSYYLTGTVFALLSTGMNQFIICQGFAKKGMQSVMLGAVLNIILDPIFIFGLHLDVAGAALATVLSQMASCAFVLLSLRRKRMPVRLRWGRMELHIVRRVLAFGLSPFLIIATDSILLIVLNTVLQRYGGPELGDTLVTCATIVQSYLLLITMPMGGLTLGSQPVVSFNYGAANLERIKRAIQSIVALCVTFCVLMTVVTHTLSPVFVGLFTQNPEVAARSVRYIKVFTAMIIPLAIQYPLVDETTALGHVRLALFCSIFRKCVFLAGLLLLPALVSPEATFLSEPIADAVAATVTTCLFLHFFPKILAQRAAREREEREEREEQPKLRHNWWRQPPKQAKMGPSGKECLI